jgi:hypothetical protein
VFFTFSIVNFNVKVIKLVKLIHGSELGYSHLSFEYKIYNLVQGTFLLFWTWAFHAEGAKACQLLIL